MSPASLPKPDHAVLQRVEVLLREQLALLGEDLSLLQPHEIAAGMTCGVHSSGALSYAWKGVPILDVIPESFAEGEIHWRFFTSEDLAGPEAQ